MAHIKMSGRKSEHFTPEEFPMTVRTEGSAQLITEEGRRNTHCGVDALTEDEQHARKTETTGLLNTQTKASLYFRDKKRSIDFVIVWDEHNEKAVTHESRERRRIFEKNLIQEGLELEYEKPEPNGLVFIKIHAPMEVLRRYGEILKLRMPMKEDLCQVLKIVRMNPLLHATFFLSQKIPALQEVHQKTHNILDGVTSLAARATAPLKVDPTLFPKSNQRYTAVYSRDREYLFDIKAPGFFTPAIHSRIVQFILDRNRFSEAEHDDFAFGIERLIAEAAYVAAYPLHDGDLKTTGSMRYKLYTEWASVSKCFHYQPLDYIKEYFGVKIALYFAWLGFYTHMLLPASVVGIICFIYSCVTLYDNQPSEDICNSQLNITMCPLCDYFCSFWNLTETCLHARITYLFDNPTTVFFAVFMSFWAATFLGLWKRYSAEITHRWDLTAFDIREEHPRPQYLARLAHVKRKHINIVTNTMEPCVPFWKVRLPATILSFSVVMLLVALAVAAVLGVVLYRMSLMAALSVCNEKLDASCAFKSYAMIFTTATAASINLCCIMVFNYVYQWLAELLTELELLRTQTEFDDSLTLKIYLLQFVNYYASIFYIAFFKGKFVGYPKEYNRLFSYRQEECSPGGCLMELCIQLGIIMIGKQAMNTLLEMLFPLFFKWLNTLKVKTGFRKKGLESCRSRWMKDFKLVEWGPRGLFPEYLEMVLQYGFVTIFVAAFPLAPFFALLNNILEMRLDAKKLLTFYRRPVTQRVRDIGVWFRILDSIGKLSVISNGFIIAFTSDFIPRMVYRLTVSPDHTLKGYLNHSLSYFNTSDFEPGSEPQVGNGDVTICRYPDFREPPWSPNKYEKTAMFWHVLAARLAFVVVFENVVALVMILVRWGIPDMPGDLRDQIRRETYITNEIIIRQEAMRARGDIPEEGDLLLGGGTENDDDSDDGDGPATVFWHKMTGSELDLAGVGLPTENSIGIGRGTSQSGPVAV
ncbi:anoctamin-1-like isoform X1 [Schistocerca piceifrons]|uniref:anoctamin-1-like isoform X1 n=1 Tax=Schistocerca piceifrons TaxID=274613 RepID=UPI001F5EE844|nr:anoctamin-1-like isoform X1 [Schistocerca piceifrons]